jgi:hypothetical protein
MLQLLRAFRADKNDGTDIFKLGPAIMMVVLILAFIASNIYVLVSSWD